jgi:hypothetical protein
MFPAGAPGIALLLLRVSVAMALIEGAPDVWKSIIGVLICIGLGALSVLLCLGLLTPVASTICCAIELTQLFLVGPADRRFLLLSSVNAAAIALLGPGAYSIDARLFGRRVITFPPTDASGRR